MDKKKKSGFFIKVVAVIVAAAGVLVYAYYFPKTFGLFDKEINKLFVLAGVETECNLFSRFSELSKEAVSFAIDFAEKLDKTKEEAEKLPFYILSCSGDLPLEGGRLTSDFGDRVNPISGKNESHSGIDIAAEYGTEIGTAWPGTVFETGFDEIYGNYVVVEHSKGFFTKYCHLSKITCSKNDFLLSGEKIGEAGSTGWSTGSHLHFEVEIGGRKIDPKECLEI